MQIKEIAGTRPVTFDVFKDGELVMGNVDYVTVVHHIVAMATPDAHIEEMADGFAPITKPATDYLAAVQFLDDEGE